MADIPVSGQTTQFTVRVIQSDAHTCKAQDQTVYVLECLRIFGRLPSKISGLLTETLAQLIA